MIYVYYIITFIKTCKYNNNDQSEVCEDSEDEDMSIRKYQHRNAFPLLDYIDLELHNRSM